jgi:hypothetical protein
MPVMAIDSDRRIQLLKQIKRGKQTGAILWTKLIVILVAGVEMFSLVSEVNRGRGSLWLVADGVVMVFIVAVAAMGLSALDLNERFTALLELIGEDE